MNDFFRSLFDFSFSSLVTPRIIRVVYIALVALSALSAVLILVNGLTGDDPNPVALIRAPLSFLFFVVIARFYLELLIVIFKIGDDVRRIADRGMGGGPSGPATGPPGPRTFI